MTLISLIAGLYALKLAHAACVEKRTVKVYPSTPLVLSCTAPSDYVTFFFGKPGARATDGNKFELYVFDAENKALYDSKQRFLCGYAYCGEPRTVWSAYVPTDPTASAVFVVIECLGGSLLNSNCDIELNLALSAARSNLVPIAPGTCQSKTYCTNMCGITDAVGTFGVCCADCNNSTSVALPVGTGSACRNQCPGIGTATATPMPMPDPPITPEPTVVFPPSCDKAALTACGDQFVSCSDEKKTVECNCISAALICSGKVTGCGEPLAMLKKSYKEACASFGCTAAQCSGQTETAPCDCDCVQQRCRDRCGSGGSSPKINTCSSLNGAIFDQSCVCAATAPQVSAAETLLGTHAHAAGLIAVPFFLRCLG